MLTELGERVSVLKQKPVEPAHGAGQDPPREGAGSVRSGARCVPPSKIIESAHTNKLLLIIDVIEYIPSYSPVTRAPVQFIASSRGRHQLSRPQPPGRYAWCSDRLTPQVGQGAMLETFLTAPRAYWQCHPS